jgi:RNase P subunit RPR2
MLIPIPHGKKFTATMTGREIREVKCEKCGAEYVYIVQVRAKGSGFSPLFLDDDRAWARAGKEAKQRVKQQLRGLHLPIPCPNCGWYQKHMVELLRKRRLYRWMWVVSLPLIWLAFKWCLTSPDSPNGLGAGLWLSVSAALAVAAAVFHFTWLDNMNPKGAIARDPTSGGVAMLKADFENLRDAKPAEGNRERAAGGGTIPE